MSESINEFDTSGLWETGSFEEPEEPNRKRFGLMRMVVQPVQKVYEKGAGFTVEGIAASDFDIEAGREENGLKLFRGYKAVKKSKRLLIIFVAELEAQDGSTYQMVKSYSNQPDRKDDFDYWKELIFPEVLAKIPKNKRATFEGPGLWVEFSEIPTGQEYDGNSIKYWGEFKIHPNEESLKAAETAFYKGFDQGKNNSTGQYDHYPAVWESSPESLKETAQNMANDGKSYQEIVAECMLEGEAINGSEVDVKALLVELLNLDISAPMINLEG